MKNLSIYSRSVLATTQDSKPIIKKQKPKFIDSPIKKIKTPVPQEKKPMVARKGGKVKSKKSK